MRKRIGGSLASRPLWALVTERLRWTDYPRFSGGLRLVSGHSIELSQAASRRLDGLSAARRGINRPDIRIKPPPSGCGARVLTEWSAHGNHPIDAVPSCCS